MHARLVRTYAHTYRMSHARASLPCAFSPLTSGTYLVATQGVSRLWHYYRCPSSPPSPRSNIFRCALKERHAAYGLILSEIWILTVVGIWDISRTVGKCQPPVSVLRRSPVRDTAR